MSRRQAPLQINEFKGGLNTDFNPLAMPPNISIDELNMDIERDGSRTKRLGFTYENSYLTLNSGVPYDPDNPVITSMFRWNNAGGDSNKALMVVQIGRYIGIHDLDDETSVSNGLIFSDFFGVSEELLASFTVIDGLLVVASNNRFIRIYEYDPETNSVSVTTDKLYIRDLFGVAYPGFTEQNNLTKRPTSLTDAHTYNLRNQTFHSPRYANNTETLVDPIDAFYNSSGNTKYPSNADSLNYYLYADPNDGDNRLIERFFSDNMVKSAPSIGETPKGYFIIDALHRGTSRLEQEDELRDENPDLTRSVTNLPIDRTPGGATVVAEYAGRVWYGGFSAQVIGGDSQSPRMSSYVLFSMLVKDRTDISQCYQRASPVSNEDPVIVDTDGGFIRIDNAYDINHMISLENSLFVFAANGVWRISGGGGENFTATAYEVNRLTYEGCVAPKSVVVVEDSIFYWGEKGIFVITKNQYGIWGVQDITEDKIKSYFLNIDEESKRRVSSLYDNFTKKIHWVYSKPLTTTTKSDELILDLTYGAFLPFSVPTKGAGIPLVVNVGKNQPYKLSLISSIVEADGVNVTAGGVNVTASVGKRQTGSRQNLYLVLTNYNNIVFYTFGLYRNTNFYDWDEEVDYDAYIVTGAFTGGEWRYKKQAPYLNVAFRRTEDGFDANLNPTNQSSCLLSARWNWTSSDNTKKWSTPREAYRYNSLYFPASSGDEFDTGETVITTRNKIRGQGHSVSFRFEGVPGKNLHLHGWSFDIMANAEE